MKVLTLVARIIAGTVFIFSGTVKGMDPFGSAFKFNDYFAAFGLKLPESAGIILAIVLCLAEFLTGFSVLTGLQYRKGLTGMTILTAFFTPLTFVLALTNPVSDCGCFGDAIHLTNWQTFGKNVVLLAVVIFLFRTRKRYTEYLEPVWSWLIITASALAFTAFSLYNLRYLPVIEYLPYKIGVRIREQMVIPEGAPADRYESTFIYEKEGVRKEFTLENYPADDTSWTFIEQKSVLIEKGYEPPIHGFSIVTVANRDITDSILDNKGHTLLMISRKLEKARPENLEEGFRIGRECKEAGIGFLILTASSSELIGRFSSDLQLCHTDEITLKTMIRSNPGYLMISDGTITGKWSWARLPRSPEKILSGNNK
jgi:uncharacterized membrane protein YphA (DoxX/SURF4 family)